MKILKTAMQAKQEQKRKILANKNCNCCPFCGCTTNLFTQKPTGIISYGISYEIKRGITYCKEKYESPQ